MRAQRASVRLLISLYPFSSFNLKFWINNLHNSPDSLVSNIKLSVLFTLSLSHAWNILITASAIWVASSGLPFMSKICLTYLRIAKATIPMHAHDWNNPNGGSVKSFNFSPRLKSVFLLTPCNFLSTKSDTSFKG